MGYFTPSMMRAAVHHLFLKDSSLTTIDVPAWIELAMCISVILEAWCWGFHVSGNRVMGCYWRWWPMAANFIIYKGGSSKIVGELSFGGWRFISPSTFLKLLWFGQPCIMITGLYACHPDLVCFRNLSWYLEYTQPAGRESAFQVTSLSVEDRARALNRLWVDVRYYCQLYHALKWGLG